MCEFCMKHGEGKKWYLEACNYAEDLLSDARRRNLIKKFLGSPHKLARDFKDGLDALDRAPDSVRRVLRWNTVRKMKKIHYGQVVPIEDVERIFEFVNSIVRVSCICRYINLGEEKRYCYGISMGPEGGKLSELLDGLDLSFLEGPDNKGLETVTKEEALASFRDHEKEGLCHTVWTFYSPFIGGICNCDRADCLAMYTTVTRNVPVMFRSEYVAETNAGNCTGCRQCMQVCQFGAIGYSAAHKTTFIDIRKCYGCGICRSVCEYAAIHLIPRVEDPVAAHIW